MYQKSTQLLNVIISKMWGLSLTDAVQLDLNPILLQEKSSIGDITFCCVEPSTVITPSEII